jgi:hypothetical protein
MFAANGKLFIYICCQFYEKKSKGKLKTRRFSLFRFSFSNGLNGLAHLCFFKSLEISDNNLQRNVNITESSLFDYISRGRGNGDDDSTGRPDF